MATKRISIFMFFLLTLCFSAESASILKWQVWSLGEPFMHISMDKKGHFEAYYFKSGPQTRALYTNKNYTCSENLKNDYGGVSCPNTCFPSYKKKAIDFVVELPVNAAKFCTTDNVKKGQYLGFKSKIYTISCPQMEVEVTTLPKLKKYTHLINKGPNNYFKKLNQTFQLSGLIAQIKLKELVSPKSLDFYRIKKVHFEKVKQPIQLPKNYTVIPEKIFTKKMTRLDKRISAFSMEQARLLAKKQPNLALNKLISQCQQKYPAIKDKDERLEICREEPNFDHTFRSAVGQWKTGADRIGYLVQRQFKNGLQTIFRSLCSPKVSLIP